MISEESSIQARSGVPKAAAISGILFAVLLIIGFVIILGTIPIDARNSEALFSVYGKNLLLTLNLVPFTGIAFLWFMGVVRDRLGRSEDQFLATVFLGSGLLFLAMLFVLAAISGSVVTLFFSKSKPLLSTGYYEFALTLSREILNTYALKMAGVFMMSTSTLFIRSHVIPRWIAFLGYALAAVMLLRIGHLDQLGWVSLGFPLWILLVSLYILIDNYRQTPRIAST